MWGCAGAVAAESEESGDEPGAVLAKDEIEVGADELVVTERSASGGYTVYGASIRTCSTTTVGGLVEQLVAEMNCNNPDAMVRIDTIPGVTLAPSASPYLQGAAARALRRVAASVSSSSAGLQVNSSLRALPQQYMLHRWSLRDRCGVRVAASPGESKHESGLALDIGNWSTRRTQLARQGFQWFGWGDQVHFTFRGAGAAPVSGESTLAFKRLWNRNYPGDLLPENPVYTRETELRLKVSPAEGFAVGASCTATL